MDKLDPMLLNPLNLAFVGDAVYEVLVREKQVSGGSVPIKKLHAGSVDMVKASAQAKAFDHLEGFLEEDERAILRRGKNANIGKPPKSSSILEYRKATAVEALFGYLYLAGRTGRIRVIFQRIDQILTGAEDNGNCMGR